MENMLKTVDKNTALYVGVDVHRFEHTAVVANRFEEELGLLSFPNTLSGIESFRLWLLAIDNPQKPRIIGIEGSNGNGKLLTSIISSDYQEIYEVNPVYTKQRRDHGTTGDKSDAVDARLVIEVLTRKLDKLPKVTLQDQSEDIAILDQLTTFHNDLIRQQTRLKNQLHRLFSEDNPDYQSGRGSSFSLKALKSWKSYLGKQTNSTSSIMTPSGTRRMITKDKIKQFEQLRLLLKKADGHIHNLLGNNNLLTLPGAGIITTAKIISKTKGIKRFNLDGFIKYAGIAPIEKQSGKTKKHKQNKSGNRQLNNALYTIALTQLRCCPKAKAYFEKKIKEGKTKKHAIRCLMKRVACIVYGMLRTGEKYFLGSQTKCTSKV